MEKSANTKKTVNKPSKTKGVSVEFTLDTYWKIQDMQRAIEEETGKKKSISSICEMLVLEALQTRESLPPKDN